MKYLQLFIALIEMFYFMIDKKELFAFKTLAETLHFGKTSEKCYLTPSALTRLIQKIEQSLAVTLFERNNRNIKLTESGKVYYQFAKEILQKYEDLTYALHPDSENITGNIRLFCTVTASYVVLPNIIRALHIKHPKIKIQLTTGSIYKCTTQLESDTTDAIISILADDIPEIYCVKKLLVTRMVLITPKSKNIQNLSDAAKQLEFIRPTHFIGNNNIEDWFDQQNFHPDIHSNVDGNEAILSLVSSGMGMSILPEIVLQHSHLSKYVEILEAKSLPEISVGIIIRKQSLKSPVKQKFWEVCQTLN